MLRTPELTEEQKQKFKDAYDAILAKAPEDVRKLGEKITFDLVGIPFFLNKTPEKLPPKLADKYVSLKNKLRSRTL